MNEKEVVPVEDDGPEAVDVLLGASVLVPPVWKNSKFLSGPSVVFLFRWQTSVCRRVVYVHTNVHAVSVFVIHPTMTQTTGSLACLHDLLMHTITDLFCLPLIFSKTEWLPFSFGGGGGLCFYPGEPLGPLIWNLRSKTDMIHHMQFLPCEAASMVHFSHLCWSTADAEVKVPLVVNAGLWNVPSLKPGVGLNTAEHASSTARKSAFRIYALMVHLVSFCHSRL